MDGCTLYLGDCADLLRSLPDGAFDAVVTDPPYGTGAWKRAGSGLGSSPVATLHVEAWDIWSTDWLHEALRVAKTVISFVPTGRIGEVWGLREPCRLLTWVKPDPRPRFAGQMAVGFEPIVALGPLQPVGGMDYCIASAPRLHRDPEACGHPHQKPLAVMDWLVRLAAPVGGTVADPFMGSASTGVAALRSGRRFLGIENKSDYYRLAVDRLRAVLEQPRLIGDEMLARATLQASWVDET